MTPEVAQQLSRIDLSKLYPAFRDKLIQLMENCNARGYHYWATCGLRTYEEQDSLYAIGRTTGKTGHYVTMAQGGFSPHQFGIACDLCLDGDPKAGLQPDYKDDHYRVLAEEAGKLQLVSGLTWNSPLKDAPHVQLPVKQMGFSWADMRKAYSQGGLPGVFALIDRWQARYGSL